MSAQVWVAIAAAIVAVISAAFTLMSARAAGNQAAESARQTELQRMIHIDGQQPYVWADIMPDSAQGSLLKVTVRNEGPTVATDIHVTFDSRLETVNDPDHTAKVQQQLREGLSYLAPNRQIEWSFDVGWQFFGSDLPQESIVEINCRGPFGNCEPNRYVVRPRDLLNSHDYPVGSLHRVTKQLENLTKSVTRYSGNHR